jgi:hypothetical protein
LQKIESKENEPVRRRVDGGAKGMEVRQAMLVLEDYLAVEQCRPTA